jgi:uncharacterized protein YigA (DUF484 family)
MNPEIDAAGVARYLQVHPEFLEQYAELVSQLHIPSPHGDKAISISERQISTLREKVRQLESKLAELIRFGEENDIIGAKVHRLAVALLAAGDFAAVLSVLYAHLGGAFAVPHVALRFWELPPVGDSAEFAPLDATARDFAIGLAHPYCGPTAGQDAAHWFGESGSHVRSLALVPLRHDGVTFGALVLASEEAHRFYVEMGTLYLTRIGDLAVAAILRTADKSD